MKGKKDAKSPEALMGQTSKLSSRMHDLLPEGTDIQQAATGFRNLGQFVAAVHVCRNLGVPFDKLKTEMVDSGKSLGQAIHALRPNVPAETEAAKAEREAKLDMTEDGM